MGITIPTAGLDPRLADRNGRLRFTYRHLALWTVQGWLAMFFIAAGYGKLTEPTGNLVLLLHWPRLVPIQFVHGVGLGELALGAGVIASLATWRFRKVVVLSSAGLAALALVMLVVHLLEPDLWLAGVNLVLAGLAVAVFRGRGAADPTRRVQAG